MQLLLLYCIRLISSYFDGHDGNTRALVPEGEVYSFFGNFHSFCLRIDYYFVVSVEPPFSGGYPTCNAIVYDNNNILKPYYHKSIIT